MNKSFVRGGQLSLHSLRMLQQLSGTLFKWWMLMAAIVAISYCYLKISDYQVYAAFLYAIAYALVSIGMPTYSITAENINAEKIILSANELLIRFGSYKNHFIASVTESLLLAISIGLVLFITAAIVFLAKGKKVSKDEKLRGGTLVEAKALRNLIKYDNKKAGYKTYSLGDMPYPAYAEQLHTMIAGTTGAGKTILICSLIDQIKRRGDKAIIYDKMGVYTERFYNQKCDTLLNPFDSRSPKWSIFNEVKSDANFDSIASALIPLDVGTTDPFWIKAARTLFAEVCGSLLKKGGVSNEELTKVLLKKNLMEAAKLVKGTAAQAIIDEKSPKTALSVMAVLSTYLKCLKFLKDEGEDFSLRNWVHNESEKSCVFITSTGDLHATLLPLISAWIEISINNLLSLSQNRDRKIWIILDELPSLHTLPSIEQGLAESRQFGGCFVLSIQSISQLRNRYGTNGSQTISSLCNNKIFLRAGDYDSARWYAENIGQAEVEEFREGLSYGAHEIRDGVTVNRQRVQKQLVLPSELTNLNDKEGYFCMAKGYPVARSEFKYTEWPKLNKRLIEVALPSEDKLETKVKVKTKRKVRTNSEEQAKTSLSSEAKVEIVKPEKMELFDE
jgi:type IV conjugative transfer system coupling protein TraD